MLYWDLQMYTCIDQAQYLYELLIDNEFYNG